MCHDVFLPDAFVKLENNETLGNVNDILRERCALTRNVMFENTTCNFN